MSAEEKFAEDVLSCVDELNGVFIRLTARYEDLVIIAACAEHVGGALNIFMRAGVCSQEQARRVLKHIDDVAFGSSQEQQILKQPDGR